jgi:hypothetical protein
VDRVVARVLILAILAVVIVVGLDERRPVERALVVAGRRAATAVGWYHATQPMSLTIEPPCTSVTVRAWGQPWIGTAPSALVAGGGRTSVVQDVGVLTRTSYGDATFADGGRLSFVLRKIGQNPPADPSCGGNQRA